MSTGFPGDSHSPNRDWNQANIPDPYGMTGPPNPQPPIQASWQAGNPGTPNAYHSPGHFPPPAGGSSTGKILLFVLLGFAGIGLVSCCGMGFAGYYVIQFGLDIKAKEVQNRFGQHPTVQEQLGGISEAKHSWAGTVSEENEGRLVYEVRGPKGSGQLLVEEDHNDQPISAKLRTPQGEWELVEKP